MFIHISTCLWIFISRITKYDNNWTYKFDLNNLTDYELYIESLFYIISTVTTVGYGNSYSTNSLERIYTTIIMVLSIWLYSVAVGKISDSVSSRDAANQLTNKKLKILNLIVNEFNIKPEIVQKIKKHLKNEKYQEHQKMIEFLDKFPEKLKQDMASIILDSRINKFNLFLNKEKNFIVYTASLMINQNFIERDFIYKSGQVIKEGKLYK